MKVKELLSISIILFCTVLGVENVFAQTQTRIVCEGQSVTFNASGSGNERIWQVNNGSGWLDIPGATNASYTITSTTGAMNGNLYRMGYRTCILNIVLECPSYTFTEPITLYVITKPTTTNTVACGPGVVTVNAASPAASYYRWYTSATGNSLLEETSSGSLVQNISTTTTYYVSALNAAKACETARTPVTAYILTSPTTTDDKRCGEGELTMGVAGAPSGYVYRWYTALKDGDFLGETTGDLSGFFTSTTTYYVAISPGGSSCETTRVPVTATIEPISVPGTITGAGPVCPGDNLTLSLEGYAGSILRWEASTDNWLNTTSIDNTSSSLPLNNITATTQYRAIVKNNDCLAVESPAVSVTVEAKGRWLGGSTNWHDPSNWCGGIPDVNTDVTVPADAQHYPVINSSTTAYARNLTIPSAATLSIESGTLEIHGNLENNGTLITNTNTKVVLNGSLTQEISGNSISFYDFEISNSLGVSLATNISVANRFILSEGKLRIADNTLQLGPLATMEGIGESSYVVTNGLGLIKRSLGNTHLNTEVLFPLGDESNYTPLRFTLTRATLSGNEAVMARVRIDESGHDALKLEKATDPNDPLYLKRVWTLEPEGNGLNQVLEADFAYNVSVQYLDDDISSDDLSRESSLVLGKYSSEKWMAGGSYRDPETNTLGASGISSFSDFTGGELGIFNATQPLPIQLVTFSARPENKRIALTWATAKEENNSYFTVERSADGTNFSPLLATKGAGSSHQRVDYKVYDSKPLQGVSYYRLKQTDYDGQYTYSTAVAVNFLSLKATELIVSPNPGNGTHTKLLVHGLDNQQAVIRIVDLLGKVVHMQEISITETSQEFTIDLAPKLPSGAYTVMLYSNHTHVQQKLIVQ